MNKIIAYTVKTILVAMASLLLFSCKANLNDMAGSGEVITQKRSITEDFSSVQVSEGLELVIEQGAGKAITVEADNNLQKHILTEVKDGKLKISADVNITSGTKKIYVQMADIDEIKADSGASVKNKGSLKLEDADIIASSGAGINLTIEADHITCEASSAGSIKLFGKAEYLECEASSSGTLASEGLSAEKVVADASSSGHIVVNPIKSLKADASSSGNIQYVTTPDELTKDASSSGTVSQK